MDQETQRDLGKDSFYDQLVRTDMGSGGNTKHSLLLSSIKKAEQALTWKGENQKKPCKICAHMYLESMCRRHQRILKRYTLEEADFYHQTSASASLSLNSITFLPIWLQMAFCETEWVEGTLVTRIA
jgi:hypothetical protein